MASGGSFSFMKALERAHPEIAKKIKEKASGGSTSSTGASSGGKSIMSAIDKAGLLKINKDTAKAPAQGADATFGRVVSEAKKQAEDPKHKATASFVKALVGKDKDAGTRSGKSIVAALKKKEKKPLSLGSAAINV